MKYKRNSIKKNKKKIRFGAIKAVVSYSYGHKNTGCNMNK